VGIILYPSFGIGDAHRHQHFDGLIHPIHRREILVQLNRIQNLVADCKGRIQGDHGFLETHGDLIVTDRPHLRPLGMQLGQIHGIAAPVIEYLAGLNLAGRRINEPQGGLGGKGFSAPALTHHSEVVSQLPL
jgi:hypothetical protein